MTETLNERAEDASAADTSQRDATLAALRAKHRFIKWWELEGYGLVVCRRMTRSEMLTFTNASQAASKSYDNGDASALFNVNETAAKTTCVWPENREILKAVFAEYPNWSGKAALAVAELGEAGITEGKD